MKVRAAAIALVAVSAPVWAYASSPSFNLDRLTLNPGGDSLLLGTGAGLQGGELRATFAGQYQHEPLTYREGDGTVGALVGYRLSAHLAAAYGISDWFEAGLQLPVVVAQGGDSIEGFDPVQSSAIGAPQVQGRFTFLREDQGAALDLGLTLGVSLPLGGEEGLTRDPGAGVAFLPRVGAGRKLGSLFRLGVEVGATVREKATLSPYAVDPDDEVGNELGIGVVASTLGAGLRGELAILGHVPLGDAPASTELLAGVRYPFSSLGFDAFVMGGPGIGSTPGTPLARVLAGVAYAPGSKPRPPACEADRSCPHMDMDGDGIANDADACPGVFGLAELRGCPDGDDDGDGVPNLSDRCPNEAGAVDHDGCPVPVRAPDPDSDRDGLADDVDPCPHEAGPAGGNGCPEPAPEPKPTAAIEGEAIAISQTVHFAQGDAALLPDSFGLLKEVAGLLQSHPEITLVRIEGHTDSIGGRAANLSLSRARAESVRAFLVQQGVASERLEAIGVGPDRPIASNEDAAGRERNRRVEFVTVRGAP